MDYQNYNNFIKAIKFTAEAHQDNVLPSGKEFRKFPSGESNPYYTHSLWCAMMILLDTRLSVSIRESGAYVLLYHDILEDTSLKLPSDTPEEVKRLVDEMTFENWEDEKTTIPNRPSIVQLLKLYDKVATLYDGCTPKEKKLKEWIQLTKELTKTVEKEYGELNIVLLSRSLTERYEKKSD